MGILFIAFCILSLFLFIIILIVTFRFKKIKGKLFLIETINDFKLYLQGACNIATFFYEYGVYEATNRNDGGLIKFFQETVDQNSVREPWCMCLIQTICRMIVCNKNSKLKCILSDSELCLQVWKDACKNYPENAKTYDKAKYKNNRIKLLYDFGPGHVVIFRRPKGGPTAGHTGIVISVDYKKRMFSSIEGNITVSKGKQGIGKRVHSFDENLLVGFINPFGMK